MPAPVSPDAERLMELLPCPFCGSDNIAVRYVRDGRQAHCQYCWASSSPEYHGRADQPSSEERAIAAWNKRATQPDAGAMAEADNIARNMAIDLVACHIAFAGTSRDDVAALTVTKDMTRQIADALNAHAARREAAGYTIVATQPDAGAMAEATDDLVDRFAAALKAKLRAAEQKYGYSDDWLRDDWQGELIAKLLHHIQKGDPRDVAAYCAFAWHHGWSITPYTHANPRRAIRELKLIATAEVDPKVREGIDRAIQHLESMVQP
jgi:hypothetical protein